MEGVQQAIATVQQRIPRNGTVHNGAWQQASLASIDALLVACRAAQQTPSPSALATVYTHLAQTEASVAASNRLLYQALVKLGRAVEKAFPTSLDDFIPPDLFADSFATLALDRTVLDYLHRAGHTEAATAFSAAVSVSLPAAQSDSLAELRRLYTALEKGDVQPVMAWAALHRTALAERNSVLGYLLVRNVFVRLAMGDVRTAAHQAKALPAAATYKHLAFVYGRENFRPYLRTHLREIQSLYAALLFLPAHPTRTAYTGTHAEYMRFVPARYRDVLAGAWTPVAVLTELFRAEYLALAGLSQVSALQTSVDLGVNHALGRVLKARSMMKQKGSEWVEATELPLSVPLPAPLLFHSTFVCPVSKEQGTEANPPMRMHCGHVIARDSLTSLARGNRVKCPYCPKESRLEEAMRLYL